MRTKYIKPTSRLINLKHRVLTQASNIHVYTNINGTLDAKGCSFGTFEEEDYDE